MKKALRHGYRKYRKDPYWSKILPSKIANFIVRKFTNSNISDHGCSLKIFKAVTSPDPFPTACGNSSHNSFTSVPEVKMNKMEDSVLNMSIRSLWL